MESIIKSEIERLENISKFMEMGNSMFTTCYAFDCFAKAVKHEIIYARSIFMEIISKLDKDDSELIYYYIDYGENWLKWKEKFTHYASFSDERGFGKFNKWSLWTDKKLYPDKYLKKEMNERGEYIVTDYRHKYELNHKLEILAGYMDTIHMKTNVPSPQIAEHYFEFKYDDYCSIHDREVTKELESPLAYALCSNIKTKTDEIIRKEEHRLIEKGIVKDDFHIDQEFYLEGKLNRKSAGAFLAENARGLSPEQKDTFLRYILIREKVEQFVTDNNVETSGKKTKPKCKPSSSVTPSKVEKQHGLDYPVFSKGSGVTDDHIKAVYRYLAARGWISTRTPENEFLRLFCGKSNNCEISWTGIDKQGSNTPTRLGISALYVLFKSLRNEQLIKSDAKVGPILESHFVDDSGLFVSNVSNVKTTSAIANDVIGYIQQCMRARPNAEDIQAWLDDQMEAKYAPNDTQDLRWHKRD